MPPRISCPQGLRSLTSTCLRPGPSPALSLQPLMQKANLSRKEKVRRMKQDPYGWAQAQQRKAANVKRQDELEKERGEKWGSPVHGIPTPFVESFDSGGQQAFSKPVLDEDGNVLEEPHPLPTSPHIMNYLLTKEELEKAISHSEKLTEPLVAEDRSTADPATEEENALEHAAKHAKAVAALQRIASLSNGSAKDIKHANIRRCIETFGRHHTDSALERPTPPPVVGVVPTPKPVRGGPDTGSSEVQIAILTTKIRALASKLEGEKGHRDKNNKRSLRSLCHKRQRLLRYMERKERGSGRWEHMIETLGLSPATWKEQITL
ncbi:hypothetical protein B0T22DRAFT_268165 [Podospora appendiculata]|uniref:Mitochondrial SSU ribosomal protein S15 n=1 Tax=Podospora appendiculata TaxID=314037 RepID=A0AAE0X3W8_9PEZI|nr:hypothetical protein B0T22DRAFT_268165 [Podospora appendiculata]